MKIYISHFNSFKRSNQNFATFGWRTKRFRTLWYHLLTPWGALLVINANNISNLLHCLTKRVIINLLTQLNYKRKHRQLIKNGKKRLTLIIIYEETTASIQICKCIGWILVGLDHLKCNLLIYPHERFKPFHNC